VPLYAVDKPLGLTSHDVVARARRILRTRKIGHAGTLDPLATGVLLLLVGEATKLSPYLSASEKGYRAWVSFGLTTATLDAEGPVMARGDAAGVDAERIEAALPPFLALSLQRPPAFAAVKQGGVKGYVAARAGTPLDLPPRPAGYARIALQAFAPYGEVTAGEGAALPIPLDPDAPTARFELDVRAGTYIRAFARDLGLALGVPAHLSGLRRLAAGRVALAAAVPLEGLAAAPALDPLLLLDLPRVELAARDAARVRDGQRLALVLDARSALVDPEGGLVAIAEMGEGRLQLLRVWREGC
jgi:tRNA pseudouridine55 synthase